MGNDRDANQQARKGDAGKHKSEPTPGSTTSLGKRRSFSAKKLHRMRSSRSSSPKDAAEPDSEHGQSPSPRAAKQTIKSHHQQQQQQRSDASSQSGMSAAAQDYGSQASLLLRARKESDPPTKVAILGAAGGIGQPLSLLLKLHSEYIQHLALYDVGNVRGVAADLDHVDRQCRVSSHQGPDELAEAVRGASVVVILAGLAQKPGMTRDDLFGTNAKILFDLVKVCAQTNPDAMLAIVSNPVNSLVPLACQLYQRLLSHPAANPQDGTSSSNNNNNNSASIMPDCCRRIFGVTTLDVIRASTLVAQNEHLFPAAEAGGLFKDPSKLSIPVIGGHEGKTIIPLISRTNPKLDKKKLANMTESQLAKLIESIQEAGIHVLNAKRGSGSATLAMAAAACRFTISLLRAKLGEPNIVECAYVRHVKPPVADLEYFALPVQLGRAGYVKAQPLGKLTAGEQKMVDEAAKLLRASIVKGEDFAKEQLLLDKQ